MSVDTVDKLARLLKRSDFYIVRKEIMEVFRADSTTVQYHNMRYEILTKHGWTHSEYLKMSKAIQHVN